MSYLGPISASAYPVINYISNGRAVDSLNGWTIYDETDSVTLQNTGDTVTLAGHGLQNGQIVEFRSVTAGIGVSTIFRYYVINATTNTFQISTSLGGTAVVITADGTGVISRDRPKLGTGGSPVFRWERNTVAPLREIADFKLLNYPVIGSPLGGLGQGISYDFQIHSADQAKVLTVSFDYSWLLQGGTLGTDLTDTTFALYIIQDPTGTPVVIQPAGFGIQVATVGTKVRQIATFQTASNVTNYRLCIHAANVNNFQNEIVFDNFQVGPQVVQYGAPVTDWQEYTPTITATTTNPTIPTSGLTTNKAIWRRVGDSIEIHYEFVTGTVSGGNNGSGNYNFSLPPGLSVDTTKIPSGSTSAQILGTGRVNSNDANGAVTTSVSTNAFQIIFENSGVLSALGSTHSMMTTNSFIVNANLLLPISGWSSTVQMSNDTDTRVVAANYNRSSGTQVLTAQVTDISFPNSLQDTHSAWNGTQFTAPISGFYCFDGSIQISTQTAGSIALFVDGVRQKTCSPNRDVSEIKHFSAVYFLNAGQIASFRAENTYTVSVATDDYHYISIYRLSGPSAIAASETVAARYYTSAGPTINNTTPVITYGTRVFDTHGAMSGNTYTIPVSGKYWFHMHVYTASTAYTAASFIEGLINKNGVLHSFLFSKRVDAAVTAPQGGNGSCIVDCSAGDTIQFRVGSGVSTTLNTTFTDSANYVDIYRVGN